MEAESPTRGRYVRPQIEVNSLSTFQQNCNLLRQNLSRDFMDPVDDLTKLRTWVDWIKGGLGTDAHVDHFYREALPAVVRALLRRRYAHMAGDGQLECVRDFLCSMAAICADALAADYPEMHEMLVGLCDQQMSFYTVRAAVAAAVAAPHPASPHAPQNTLQCELLDVAAPHASPSAVATGPASWGEGDIRVRSSAATPPPGRLRRPPPPPPLTPAPPGRLRGPPQARRRRLGARPRCRRVPDRDGAPGRVRRPEAAVAVG